MANWQQGEEIVNLERSAYLEGCWLGQGKVSDLKKCMRPTTRCVDPYGTRQLFHNARFYRIYHAKF
jgi:hypothetical protein